jgi:hypothetical protein
MTKNQETSEDIIAEMLEESMQNLMVCTKRTSQLQAIQATFVNLLRSGSFERISDVLEITVYFCSICNITDVTDCGFQHHHLGDNNTLLHSKEPSSPLDSVDDIKRQKQAIPLTVEDALDYLMDSVIDTTPKTKIQALQQTIARFLREDGMDMLGLLQRTTIYFCPTCNIFDERDSRTGDFEHHHLCIRCKSLVHAPMKECKCLSAHAVQNQTPSTKSQIPPAADTRPSQTPSPVHRSRKRRCLAKQPPMSHPVGS